MHRLSRLAGVVLLLALSACATDGEQPDISPEESAQRAELMRQLPQDADMTRLEEQLQWLPNGYYITRSGGFAPLPQDSVYRQVNTEMEGRPTFRQQKAERVEAAPIKLELPDAGH